MSGCFECCRKTILFLAYAVSTVGSISYCFYLVWLLAYLKGSGYYWFFAFIPTLLLIRFIVAAISKDRDAFLYPLFGVLLMVMCSFTMLTRQAYYHSANILIAPKWVIMSLQGSIAFFVCGFLIQRECRLQGILEDKDILYRALLDFVDIFDFAERSIFLRRCVGIGSSVTEVSSLEMAIQAFCTISLLIILCVIDPPKGERNKFKKTVHGIYMASPVYHNIPFLVIRIIIWAEFDVYSLGFMQKNIWAIFECYANAHRNIFGAHDEEPSKEPNVKHNHDQPEVEVIEL